MIVFGSLQPCPKCKRKRLEPGAKFCPDCTGIIEIMADLKDMKWVLFEAVNEYEPQDENSPGGSRWQELQTAFRKIEAKEGRGSAHLRWNFQPAELLDHVDDYFLE